MHSKKPSLTSIQFLLNNDSTSSNNSNRSEIYSSSGRSVTEAATTATAGYYTHSRRNSYSSTGSDNNASPVAATRSRAMHHKKHNNSISSLPFELQQLSIAAPTPSTAIGNNNRQLDIPNYSSSISSSSDQSYDRPSWMLPQALSATLCPYQQKSRQHYDIHNVIPSTTTGTHRRGRPSGRSHGRSVSDFYLTNPLITMNTTAISSQQPQNRPPTSAAAESHSEHQLRKAYQKHRRAISAIPSCTVDANIYSNNTTALPHIEEQIPTITAQAKCPPLASQCSKTHFQQQEELLQEALKMTYPLETVDAKQFSKHTHYIHEEDESEGEEIVDVEEEPQSSSSSATGPILVSRNEMTGKYSCPYCSKAFNRPSSLKIHTYSHTGEKPFVCQEAGCGRQFSVQSNMRRHLRVHSRRRNKLAAMAAMAAAAAVIQTTSDANGAEENGNNKITTAEILTASKRKGKRGRKFTAMVSASAVNSTVESSTV